MIIYKQGSGLYQTLFRVHGSALYKGIVPALLSTLFLLILEFASDEPNHDIDTRWFSHPYPIAAMVAFFTFLLTFKCSFSYNRYWEACTSIHQMQSKWLDAGIELAAWHLQSKRYESIKPPTFGAHPNLNAVVRKRKLVDNHMTPQKLKHILDTTADADDVVEQSFNNTGKYQKRRSLWHRMSRGKQKSRKKSIEGSTCNAGEAKSINSRYSVKSFDKPQSTNVNSINNQTERERTPFQRKRGESCITAVTNLDGGMESHESPSLFLQEASHLISLLSAVAFTTLRVDLLKAPAPLNEYKVGSPWPSADPDADEHTDQYYESSSLVKNINYILGNERTDAQRTIYNSCRPMSVLGGVSDAEIEMLQRARGPVAKIALCSLWLQEFISREFENGALGNTAPPIVSRLYQFVSDGTLGYHQARKVAYIPFPFPHTQLTTFYVVVVNFFLPILMLTYVNEVVVAAVLNFLTAGVFVGLWYVSNELEDPFRNVPNDLPLNLFQAELNEALVVMFAGYHPEAWWGIEDKQMNSIDENTLNDIPEKVNEIQKTPPSRFTSTADNRKVGKIDFQ